MTPGCTLWEIGLSRSLPVAEIDHYEEIYQVNLINESIKHEMGSLPEELLSGFHHGCAGYIPVRTTCNNSIEFS